MLFENLKHLKQDMLATGWIIDSFYFLYQNQWYIVLVKLFERGEEVPEYASVKLVFLKEEDFTDTLSVYANAVKILASAKTLREYFGIAYCENLGEVLFQFSTTFAEFIPSKVNEKRTQAQREAMCNSLSKSDYEDPRKKYCFAVRINHEKKNGEPIKRSDFNDNKTRILRPDLYAVLGSERSISFRYSMNPEKEETDEAIFARWFRSVEK